MGSLFQDTTAPLAEEELAGGWIATIVAHPQLEYVGRSATIDSGQSMRIGRSKDTFGPGALDDSSISRRHADLELDGRGRLEVTDLGSHNGTVFEGRRIDGKESISSGLLSVGHVVIHVGLHSAARDRDRVVEVARTLLDRARPIHLVGPPGAGKRRLAAHLHELCGGGPCEWVEVRSHEAWGAALDSEVSEGTLVVVRLDRASEAHAQQLVELLDSRRDDSQLRLIFTSRTPPAPLSGPGPACSTLRGLLAPFMVEVPPLHDRVTDIARLIVTFAHRYAGAEARVEPGLVIRLLRHGWPGNVRELEAIVERVVVESGPGTPLRAFADLDGILATTARPELISTHGGVGATQPFEVARSGAWFRCPDGVMHDLRSRRVLMRTLATLIDAHRRRPGSALSVATLVQAVWPDVSLMAKAGANRVYVAMTGLRNLGLRELVVRGDDGYSISTDVELRVAED